MVGVFRVLASLEEASSIAVVVAAVLVVVIGASVKEGIAALDSEKGSSNFLILTYFLLA